MYRKLILAGLTTVGLSAGAIAAEPSKAVGIVDFAKCVTDSKRGQKEQSSFETLKNQMTDALQDTEKQLNEIAAKFNDSEYLDGLSPEAEQELKEEYRKLSEEINRYQGQYYQVLNQANMRIIQSLSGIINDASEKVASDNHLHLVLNKEACFFFSDKLDVTSLVIAEMDKSFEIEEKQQVATKAAANDEVK